MPDALESLLAHARVDVEYTDALGVPTRTTLPGQYAILRALGYEVHDDASAGPALEAALERKRSRKLEPVYVVAEHELERLPSPIRSLLGRNVECGYYDVETAAGRTRVIVTPSRAFVPAALESRRMWGYAAQLYSLRSERNWGIGDFSDLGELAVIAARNGADAVALNPLHQGHLTNPAAASPYAPLSRRHLNALYIDVSVAASRCGVTIDLPVPDVLRSQPLIDYTGVALLKVAALERIFAATDRRDEVRAYAKGDPGLHSMALYEAIMEYQTARDPNVYGWTQWPEEFHARHGSAVRAFERGRQERIEFYVFLQWLADEQLATAAKCASDMSIGLYRDLAVGVDLASVDVWADPDVYALGLSVGAPPDPLNEEGQNWGLPPFHPERLVERAYEPFISLLRANMRHAGALRIDHVMGLKRLFSLARDNPAAGGAYINYDFEAMLGIVALESRRHSCLIVGEDLGTVPEGFRERLTSTRIFTCRVLFFEREWDGRFRAPTGYTRDAVASTGTHDLPTLAGFWSETGPGKHSGAAETREKLIDALVAEGVLAPADAASLRMEGANPSEASLTALSVAAYRYLGRTSSKLALLQLEDALGQREQVNVPGTVNEEPNWQRRLSVSLEDFERHPLWLATSRALHDERP